MEFLCLACISGRLGWLCPITQRLRCTPPTTTHEIATQNRLYLVGLFRELPWCCFEQNFLMWLVACCTIYRSYKHIVPVNSRIHDEYYWWFDVLGLRSTGHKFRCFWFRRRWLRNADWWRVKYWGVYARLHTASVWQLVPVSPHSIFFLVVVVIIVLFGRVFLEEVW